MRVTCRRRPARWNVVGHSFRDLHRHLDDIVDAAGAAADRIAERMRALGAAPDASSDKVSATTTLPLLPGGEQDTATVAGLLDARLSAQEKVACDPQPSDRRSAGL